MRDRHRMLIAAGWVLLGITLGVALGQNRSAQAQEDRMGGGGTGARYTVIETEATNLLVTDNRSNTLYFYTGDRGASVGAPLKLRGSLDLNKVGQASITPKKGG